MSTHITLEELSKFIWIRQVTEETVALSLRINTHLMECESCVLRVMQMQSLYDQSKRLRRTRSQLAAARELMMEERLMQALEER